MTSLEQPVKNRVVTVFGSSTPKSDEPAYKLARQLGQAIAEHGWVLCNGGYGGTMEAAARGASDAGGHTIGVTCSILNWRGRANAYVKQEVPTFDLHTRLNTLVRLAHAYVVLPGGTGTLLELALVWELFSKGMLKRKAPIILLGDHWRPLDAPVRAIQPDALQLPITPDVPATIALIETAWNRPDAESEDE